MLSSILSLGLLALASSFTTVTASPVRLDQSIQRRESAESFTFVLPYDTAALAPFISNETNVVHLTLVAGAVAALHAQSQAIESLLSAPDVDFFAINSAATVLTKVSGALTTHMIYFNSLAPVSEGGGDVTRASPSFAAQVTKDFGSFPKLIAALNAETLLVPASGWGWLAWDTNVKSLIVTRTNNQDLLDASLKPLLNIDIFEHAFILDTEADKAKYLQNLQHIYNWKGVSDVFAAASSGSS
ncbi:hypothetical protein RQP46_001243 [Phenoliferia psychrophenolica]